jgi:glycosyltransferase involved in cell wall biosynthesis/peptidoglycan/xylan/chitin deacetylase (PgdA/CDA1 family)
VIGGLVRASAESLLRIPRLADRLARTLPPDCLIVLTFHRVGDDLPPWHLGTTPAAFEQTVKAFARCATPVDLRDPGALDGAGRKLALTFDDGFEDNAKVAAPLLVRLGLPATFFLPSECIETGLAAWPELAYARLLQLETPRLERLATRFAPDRRAEGALPSAHAVVHGLKLLAPGRRERFLAALPPADDRPGRPMTWAHAEELVAAGFAVGSHGHSHAVLTTLDDEPLAFELTESKRLIEARLPVVCDLLGYPDDRTDERVAAAAAAAGYRIATRGGNRVNAGPVSPLLLSRISGEGAGPAVTALRLRREAARGVAVGERMIDETDGRVHEYGFLTQARLVLRLLEQSRPASVLDAGCGTAALLPWLREAGAREVVGVDAEPGKIAMARRRFPESRWLRADLRNLPFAADEFDAGVCLGVLEYIPDHAEALRELVRVVKPGGPVIVSVLQRAVPNELGLRLARFLGFGPVEPARPLRRRELVQAAEAAGLRISSIRATNFFAFPFDALFPRPSERLAERLDRAGGSPFARRLGSQLVLEARAEPPRAVTWLSPYEPVRTTFLDRELEGLHRLGVPVEHVVPGLGVAALETALRRPVASLALALRLQLLKAPLDRERGRLGYVILALKGMALARQLERSRNRVHATFADGVGTIAYCAAHLARVPFTFTAHSPYSLWQGSALLRRQAEAAERVFCVSSDIERRLGALAPSSRRTLVGCVGPERRPPRGEQAAAPLFLAVGTFVPHKGFGTALEALALASARGVAVRLELIGDGPELEGLRARAARRSLGSYVDFRGRLPNDAVLDRLASSLALLVPSEVQPDGDRDGLPVAILDAAACGVPAIATAISGIPDFVVDGVTGLIVPEHDPEALLAAMARLVDDPALAARLGRAARDRLDERHDSDRELRKLAEAWFPGRYTEAVRSTS